MTQSVDQPRLVQALSLYRAKVNDLPALEFHIQLLETEPGNFCVHTQQGERAGEMSHVKNNYPHDKREAENAFQQKLKSVRNDGYRDVDLTHLGDIYAEMSKRNLDNAGIDLCIERQGEYITLVQYANEAAVGGSSQISSYSSARSARDALRELGVAEKEDAVQVLDGLSVISRMLLKAGLDEVGVFVGYTMDDGKVYRGVPSEFQVAARNRRV